MSLESIIYDLETGLWQAKVGGQTLSFARPSEARAALAAPPQPPTPEPTPAAIDADAASEASEASEATEADEDALPPPDPTLPFGVSGGPEPDQPISPAALDRAAAHVLAHYREILDDKGSDATTRQVKKARALLRDDTAWSILADGTITVKGSDCWYRVSDNDPPCADRDRRGAKGGYIVCKGALFAPSGFCYHQIARELLRLAQLALPKYAPEPEPEPPAKKPTRSRKKAAPPAPAEATSADAPAPEPIALPTPVIPAAPAVAVAEPEDEDDLFDGIEAFAAVDEALITLDAQFFAGALGMFYFLRRPITLTASDGTLTLSADTHRVQMPVALEGAAQATIAHGDALRAFTALREQALADAEIMVAIDPASASVAIMGDEGVIVLLPFA